MTPAPMRINFSGTLLSFSAPVEDTICSSSTGMPGKGVTSEPVAIRMFLVLTVSLEPSSLRTVTSLGPVILPWPWGQEGMNEIKEYIKYGVSDEVSKIGRKVRKQN